MEISLDPPIIRDLVAMPPRGVRFTTPGKRHLGITYFGVETSGWCNRSCSFCPANKWPETSNKGSYMAADVFEHFVQELEHWGEHSFRGGISLYGNNEALLDKGLVQKYTVVSARLPHTKRSLATNADLLTLEKARELFKAGVESMLCNCYDATGKTLGKVREIAKALEAEDGIQIIANPVRGFHPMVDHNEGKVLIIHDARSAGLNYPGATSRAGNVPDTKVLAEPLRMTCSRPWTHVHLQWDGNLLVCCQDWRNEHVIGNIMESSIKELYNSEKMEQVRRQLFLRKRAGTICEKCDWGTNE